MFKQNLHTHSLYCDGKDTIEEMVQEAISRKFLMCLDFQVMVIAALIHIPCRLMKWKNTS
ncbi:Histidinol phosphatase and related hydrolases of the PHP family [Faecalitalea cylindroides T2-87]|uniref:Histidinol phosphatase and related hydrolases of the PHP family n=1 Tax=Faecalitalea cylindroides T2-87 TaxID=717960 RepID=D4JDB4_9FIRM|nr:Histidinol phosphatase and related hydrolases of the PHP family [Faecalitalea cylindroides T2-87]